MDITLEYAIAAGGILTLFFLANLIRLVWPLCRRVGREVSKHLSYTYLVRRHRYLGPWTAAAVLAQVVYVAGNVFCLSFHAASTAQVGRRAGSMALINMVPLFGGPHLNSLADALGVSLVSARRVHRSTGIMASALVLVHLLFTLAATPSFELGNPQNIFAIIGASSLCLGLLLALPSVRRLSYEAFLRSHQAFAGLLVYSMWRHLPSRSTYPRTYLYIAIALLSLASLTQVCSIAIRNGIVTHRRARAQITHQSGVVRVQIHLKKPLMIRAGQHISLWIPSVSFWSFAQSHPFVVISWADGPQKTLDLFIEPRRGLTRELLIHAESPHSSSPLVLVSGPHGHSEAVDRYETVLMVASGFGIAGHLPYLKRLIHGHNASNVLTRRVHLVWEIHNIELVRAAETLLNGALEEDRIDDGRILEISIYWESNTDPAMRFGKRATMFPGRAPLKDIFLEEVSGQHVERWQADVDWNGKSPVTVELESGAGSGRHRRGDMLVMASAADDVRDELRMLVRNHVVEGVRLEELDYQPS